MKNLKITTQKRGLGQFNVFVFDTDKHEEIGTFETTDSQLIDDIHELNNGIEDDLIMHDTFQEVESTCLSYIF